MGQGSVPHLGKLPYGENALLPGQSSCNSNLQLRGTRKGLPKLQTYRLEGLLMFRNCD